MSIAETSTGREGFVAQDVAVEHCLARTLAIPCPDTVRDMITRTYCLELALFLGSGI